MRETFATYDLAVSAALKRNRERKRRTSILVLLDPAARRFTIRNGTPDAGQAVAGSPVLVALVTSMHWVIEYHGIV